MATLAVFVGVACTIAASVDHAGETYFRDIAPTGDGGYIMCGTTGTINVGYDAWVLKVDSSAQVIWQYHFGTPNDDRGYCIQQCADGGYVMGGGRAIGYYKWSAWVLKLPSSGRIAWQKTYGEIYEGAVCVRQCKDGGYILCAGQEDAQGEESYSVYKLNSSGRMAWKKTFQLGYSYWVEQTADGGYLLAGGGVYSWDYRPSLIKLDSSGRLAWQKTYPDNGRIVHVQLKKDGGCVVAGEQSEKPWIGSTNSAGKSLWGSFQSGYDYGRYTKLRILADGSIVAVGVGPNGAPSYIQKRSSKGKSLWLKTNKNDAYYSLVQTSDGGFLVAGHAVQEDAGLLVKYSSTGMLLWRQTYEGFEN